MPESSAWPDIQRWGHYNDDNDNLSEEHVVVHNELYISENDEEEIHEDEVIDDHLEANYLEVELEYDSSDEKQSHLSGISQQDRDNKTILLRQAASGELI